jgi:hypothetical protein
MHTYLIQTNGTAQITKSGSSFYFQDNFLWIVDLERNPVFAIEAKQVKSIELIK